MKIFRKLLAVCYYAVFGVIVVTAVLLMILYLIGIRPYAVKTGSMEPTIKIASLCFVDRRVAFEEIREGDIIAFRSGEMLITHRAVAICDDGIVTKGDANNAEDASMVTSDNYIGKTIFWLKEIGVTALYLQTLSGKLVFAGAILLYILSGVLYDMVSSRKNSTGAAEE